MECQLIVDLRKLKNAANEILEEAKRNKNQIDNGGPGWAVNWASLSCTRAAFYMDDEGDRGYIIDIEEADPNAYNFAMYVRQKLAEIGFENVEVKLEW